MSIPGVDYAWTHPGGEALQKAGKHFACRYLSTDASKNLTRAEADDLAAHEVSSVVVWETTAERALSGKSAGAADAKAAAAQATACGMPSSRPIYFAVDFDATPDDQTAINAYLDGAASVIGVSRVGLYGGYYPVKRALDAGKATWAWQTSAWSGGQWDSRAVIRQGAETTINGVSCDLDTALTTDYGQWMPGKTPQETNVAVTKNDVGTFAHTDGVFKSPDYDKDPKGNEFWTLESYQRYGYLQDRETNRLVKDLAAKPSVDLTDAQIDSIAAKVAAAPGLADAIAEKVAEKIAERLAQ
ncbi:DUF1906 domain-containing protein [Streptomyces pluripotens]|uniref:DUF1906 domain-containing protein n=1 Tax=Streptomyces pluripotens TaxID=1355015 RepID=A0A221P778_9ACTN|nr:hypothetical protein LK06_002225 [Streptomyces pluripotens]ASN28163.1 DUF1906 domain-containing protein [Streptomyces pluripotens]MCH0556958.1 DUF1906 domain-containing protein [Streptomyces sp. MUM 16J]